MPNSNQVDSARQTYSAVLRALDASLRWQKQEAAQAEGEYAQTIQTAEAARAQAEQIVARMRTDGMKRANDTRTRVEETVKRGESLYNSANMGKLDPQFLPPPHFVIAALPPDQALARAADLAEQACNKFETKLAEYERAQIENSLTLRRTVMSGVIIIGVALVIIIILALRS